jgi:hypothetical protein
MLGIESRKVEDQPGNGSVDVPELESHFHGFVYRAETIVVCKGPEA